MPSQSELLLVGVVHRDPLGEERLLRLLQKRQPSVVALELSEPSVEFRRQRGPALRTRLIESVRSAGRQDLADQLTRHGTAAGIAGELALTLELPFELRAAESWARERSGQGAGVELLDDPGPARRAVELIESELLGETNVRHLLEREAKEPVVADPVDEQYRAARRYFNSPHFFRYHFSSDELDAMVARDAYVSEGLMRLCQIHQKVVYVCGWEHLVDAGVATLWPRWKERARRMLLADAPV